ncbi:MAG: peroxiredoxin-like family protein [Ferruginibacter sp.]
MLHSNLKKICTLFIAILFVPFFTFAQHTPLGLQVNDNAPTFTSKDQNGKTINLKNALKQGPVVIVFYRGQWCPYCNKQLMRLEDSLSLITGKGATLIAVTPEKPANISKTIEKTKATYPVLFDDGLKIMKSYDVAFAVDTATIEKYKKYGIDFNEANGVNGANLPVPAVYIINQKGVIVFRYFDPDYRKRVTVAEILTYL